MIDLVGLSDWEEMTIYSNPYLSNQTTLEKKNVKIVPV